MKKKSGAKQLKKKGTPALNAGTNESLIERTETATFDDDELAQYISAPHATIGKVLDSKKLHRGVEVKTLVRWYDNIFTKGSKGISNRGACKEEWYSDIPIIFSCLNGTYLPATATITLTCSIISRFVCL